MTANELLVIRSDSRQSDGGFLAVADIPRIAPEKYRVIGGIAVMLHTSRYDLDLPLRKTADADLGVLPVVLNDESLPAALRALGYTKIAGQRWEREVDHSRRATIDVLVPNYSGRARSSKRFGTTVTTEVPGLAEAFQRPSVRCELRVLLTTGETIETDLLIPDEPSMLALKAYATTVRTEARDLEDIWRCLEFVHAAGKAATFRTDPLFAGALAVLRRQVAGGGPVESAIVAGLQRSEAEQRVTRLRALARAITGG